MGDSGSTLLGFIVVWFTIAISQGEARALSPVLALWFALVPLADSFSCFVRRVAKSKLPLAARREHFHDLLMRAGLSVRQTLAVLAGFALLYAGMGLTAAYLQWPDWPMFAAWMTLLVFQNATIKRIALLYRLYGAGPLTPPRKALSPASAMWRRQPRAPKRNRPSPIDLD